MKNGKSLQKKKKNKLSASVDQEFSCINDRYIKKDFKKQFRSCWRENGDPINDESGLEVMKMPLNCAFLPNMFTDTSLINDVREELNQLKLNPFNNDLYKFKSVGLMAKESSSPNIEKICQHLKGPVKQWVQEVCGIPLNDVVSINSSIYKYSDTLLCHDDELEYRRIAFILYLSPEWKSQYGGTLDLFSIDKLGRPKCIEKKIVPQFNGFSFFEVSPASYHQVSEVLSKTKSRISINGWFHGDPIPFPTRPGLQTPIYVTPGHVEEQLVYSWISPLYLDQNTQAEVRKEFQDRSEIQLSDFLKSKKYKELSEEFRRSDHKWQFVGPPYKRHYELIRKRKDSPIIRQFLSLMRSEAMFLIFSQLTGLRLHPLAPEEEDDEDCSEEENEETSSGSKVPLEDCEGGNSCRQYNDVQSYSSSDEETAASRSSKRKKSEKKKAAKKQRKLDAGNSPVNDATSPPQEDLSVLETSTTLNQEWLSDLSEDDTDKVDLDPSAVAEITTEVRRWRWGSYSLMRDDDLTHSSDFTLDASFFCNGTKNWGHQLGGATIYVAKGETQQLLTVLPMPNTLALVYRDADTFKFTKHINVKSTQLDPKEAIFHEVSCQFRERKINKG